MNEVRFSVVPFFYAFKFNGKLFTKCGTHSGREVFTHEIFSFNEDTFVKVF